MSTIKLTYFDFNGGRGEDCRIALHLAGVAFEDDRIGRGGWMPLKPSTPYGSLPVLHVDGAQLAQSNAILSWIGLNYGLLPADSFQAARHLGVMVAVEELRSKLGPTLSIKDPGEKKAAREAIAAEYFPRWTANMSAQIGDGPFVGGSDISVADLKLYMVMRWIVDGGVDHITADVFAATPNLMAHHEAVRTHEGVAAWNDAR
jgi:glutathione S-transferase